jgi:alginate O-acetyltransferase complex protein AlgI
VVFASFVFLFWFLPAFLPLYFAAPVRLRNVLLTLASFVFYGWWRPHYVLLMLFTVALDYTVARVMGEPGQGKHRKLWITLSIAANLGLLGWFKYANLFVGTWNDVTPWPVEWEQILLPVGISFFTFQSMSYTIDVYRGDVKPVRSFLDLLCFVSMFPQLVAGPIVRYTDVAHELRDRRTTFLEATDGVFLFAIGFAKKVLIADSIAPFVDHGYALTDPTCVEAWLAAVGFCIQIYFDFSGYSDMAIGLGLVLGFHFPANFRSPFRAHSITEIWRRWHISLSTWLRDYLYVPLGGNRKGEARARLNLFITMALGGLWHGAAWTYVIFGMIHGCLLAFERWLGKRAPYDFLPHWAQVAMTFLIWNLALVVFRSDSMARVGQMYTGMFGGNGLGALPPLGQALPFAVGGLGLGLFIVFAMPRSEQLVMRFHPLVMLGTMLLFVLAVAHMLGADFLPFLYYQF